MRIHAINAFEGDCLLLESGTAAPSYALIDGGPRGTFNKHLKPYLDKVIGEDGTLEAVLVSHVDADHISGVLDLFAELEAAQADGAAKSIKVVDLWHNSFARTLDNQDGVLVSNLQSMMSRAGKAQVAAANGSIALLGIGQGERLRRQALKLKIPLNGHMKGELVSADLADGAWTLGDAEFEVVGPTAANLQELKLEWAKWIEDNLESFAAGDAAAMANADKSVPNLSSIVLVGTSADGDMLLTGDARGDHILQGLEQTGAVAAGAGRHFRLIKLQHHGSDRNVDEDFFRRLTADIYLVSADGKHGNPDLATLELLVDVAKDQGRQPLIVSTNAPPAIDKLQQSRPTGAFGYRLAVRQPNRHAILVDLGTGNAA